MAADFRVERDSMGELRVPAAALWGAQTQRAVNNFPISGLPMPPRVHPRARADQVGGGAREPRPGLLPAAVAKAIEAPALEVADGKHDEQFPIDVFQTGSGTSQHERERGHRAPRDASARDARARQRPRQHEPEQQRRRSRPRST